MELAEIEKTRIEKAMTAFMERRRPQESIRSKLDLGYRISGQSLELFEIRPRWDMPEVILEHSFAKATNVRTQQVWKVYWIRGNLKWHKYDPAPEVSSIEKFLAVVDQDEYSCFFG
jgi:hypothetical protein